MGANTFYTKFSGAVARYEHGHGGYTGTIAEKDDFIMINCPTDKDPYDFATELINTDDSRIDDKWGSAGCIALEESYLFFGWASS